MKKRWILLLILLAAVVYFWRIEPQWLQTSEYTLSSPQLPETFSGLRIVELADLHGEMFGEEHANLLRAVREASPDVIAIDGDFFDERTDVSTLDPLLTGLTEIAPVYYVTGNHEWTVSGLPDILAHFEELGITVLANEYVTLERGSERIALAGVHDPNGPYDMKTKEQLVTEIRTALGEDVYILMLAHRNGQLDEWAQLGVQTVLAGHGHGGIIRIPFVGGLLSVDGSLFPTYDAGVFREGNTAMVVSRGLGNSIPIPRLFNRPELPVITLEGAD